MARIYWERLNLNFVFLSYYAGDITDQQFSKAKIEARYSQPAQKPSEMAESLARPSTSIQETIRLDTSQSTRLRSLDWNLCFHFLGAVCALRFECPLVILVAIL